MFCKVFFFFIIQCIDSIVDCENVLGIKHFLSILHKLNACWWSNSWHESLSEFANTMMMRKTSSLVEYFISAFIFNVFINLHNFISWSIWICVIIAKIHINSCTCLIHLSHSEWNKESVLLDAMRLAGFVHTLSHIID